MKNLLLVNQDLLKPDFGLGVWVILCTVIIILSILSFVRFLIKNNSSLFKNKNRTKAFATVFLLISLFSCIDTNLNPNNNNEVTKLVTDFSLKAISESKPDDKNALHFNSVSEARVFLNKIKNQKNDFSMESGEINVLQAAYQSGLSNSQRSQLRLSLNSKAQSREGYDGNEGNETPPGSGAFSQTYFPWNSVSVHMSWDNNGNITNLQSMLTGYTLGASWNQLSYNQLQRDEDGKYIIQVMYTISYTLFVEGVGTIWTSEPRTSYIAIFGIGGGGGSSSLDGTIHSSLAGALARHQQK